MNKNVPSNSAYKQGRFIPFYPDKYVGDLNKIYYRSSWEEIFMTKYCDQNINCLKWSSEEIAIPYYNPIDKKMHKYFIDFFCLLKNDDGTTQGVFIEIKPYKELNPPVFKETRSGRASIKKLNRYNREAAEYVKNCKKWEAAKAYAEERNAKFIIITEYSLGLKKAK